jgi:arylsulfatase A-like enzyme
MTAWRVLLTALAAAAWTGLAEVVPLSLEPRLGVMVRLGEEYVWMAPLGNLIFFGVAALLLLALGRFRPRLKERPAVVGTFAGLATAALLPERIHPLAVLLLAVGVGVQVGRMTRKPAKRPWVVPTAAAAGVLVVLGLTLKGETGREAWRRYWLDWLPPAAPGAPNVLLLILDTVRAASLELTGEGAAPAGDWPAVDAPEMEALAARSTVFTRAIAASPWTLPSHASMFTGRWPTEIWDRPRPGAEWSQAMDTRYTTVAEALARHGYMTGGFVGNLTFAAAETGLVRGFLDYVDYPVSLGQTLASCALGRRVSGYSALRRLLGWHELVNRKDAAMVAQEFLDWQAGLPRRPFFAFVNFFDAHEPYFPPDSVIRALPAGAHWDRFDHYAGVLTGTGASRSRKWEMSEPERAAHAAGYADAITRMDREVGRILDELGARGVLDNTIVVLVSDHGEQLGEHGLYNHDNSLYLLNLHVPLLIQDPTRPAGPRRVDEVVTLRDVGATILDLVGVDPGEAGLGGASLMRWTRTDITAAGIGVSAGGGPAARDREPAFSTLAGGADNEPWYPVSRGPVMYSLMDSAWHYVRNGDGSEELYAPAGDPAEREDLAPDSSRAAVLEEFRARLLPLAPWPPPPPPTRPR